ncbi:MAG TPA: acetylglutamate kinase, partial [Acidimicrobiales bacterium]|nr:acetylglutamate kinase [Acidimicrobiales bacterium]
MSDQTQPEAFSPDRRAAVLVETLPYIQRFRGSVVVVKFGGNAMVDADLAARFAAGIVLMHSVVLRRVGVHGGGPQIGTMLGKFGIEW